METIKCKGTPAQVARRVLAVLAEDPDLNWHVNVAGAYPDDWPDRLLVCGRLTPDIPDDQALVKVAVLRGSWPVVGYIDAEQLPGYALVTAHKRGRKTELDTERGTVRSTTKDFAALAPVWEKVKAELTECGLVIDAPSRRPTGRPGLDRAELIYRLAIAQEAKEIKERDKDITWPVIASYLRWHCGTDDSGIKLLQYARQELARLQKSDPDHLLDEVAAYRDRQKERK